MKACMFRKMQCNAGHFSKAFAADEMLPRRCPICGQPYDRRYNRPIMCYEDGSVPEEDNGEVCKEESEPQAESVFESTLENTYKENTYKKEEMMQEIPNPQNQIRRGRQISGLNAPDHTVSTVKRSERRVVLYTGGFKIEIPEYGGCLGREELGKECLQANLLVSKKHAYVEADYFGNLHVRDAGSLNGTYVDDGNGRRPLKTDETAVLKAGNRLWLADQIFVVEEDNV